MHPVAVGARVRRPTPASRAFGTGALLLLCALVLALTVPQLDGPAAAALVGVVGVAGVTLLSRGTRLRSEALAAALGAGLLLAAMAPFVANPAVATVVGGVGLAVVGVASWRLHRRREWAPWFGTRGVLLAAGAALVLLGAAGVVLVGAAVPGGGVEPSAAALTGGTVLPWAGLVGAAGWLRLTPALALLLGPTLQMAALAGG